MSSVVPSPQRPGPRSATVIDLTEVRNDAGSAQRKAADLPPPIMPPRRQRLIDRMASGEPDVGYDSSTDNSAGGPGAGQARDAPRDLQEASPVSAVASAVDDAQSVDPADPVAFAKRLAGLIAEQRALIDRLADRSVTAAPPVDMPLSAAPPPVPPLVQPPALGDRDDLSAPPGDVAELSASEPTNEVVPLEPMPLGAAGTALAAPIEVAMRADVATAALLPATATLARALSDVDGHGESQSMLSGHHGRAVEHERRLEEAASYLAEEERPPMIIERAYAEAAAGPALVPVRPSALPGLLTGFLLAACGGAGLYFYLMPGG